VAKSKEELKAINAANYQKNREARLAYAKEYYKAHKEERDLKGREWARKNVDKTREYNRKSYQKDPSKAIIRSRQRKIKMMGVGYKPYTLEQVLEEYGQVCYLCELEIDLTLPRKIGVAGWEFGLHLDHVTPISKGGQDCLENVAPTHAICNLNKRGN
jgi:5-methylcytosine-specific restriction endonuclease McrA